MPYYRKKPIPVEARQFTGDNFQELQYWDNDFIALSDYNEDTICVHTLEGPVWGEKGDYIVKGVRGEFYICQKDLFEETYEPSDKHDATTIRPTPIIDMFSGTGELARAVSAALVEPSCPVSFSDTYGPARKYLNYRCPDVEVRKDFRDQDVPEGSIVTIGAPCQDLSVAGKHAGAERDSNTRSALIHEALDMAVAGGAALIVAENVPNGHSVYLSLADWLRTEHDYATTVSSAGAWEVGALHRRERLMLVAARQRFEAHRARIVRYTAPRHQVPTPMASSSTGPGSFGRSGGDNLQTWVHTGNRPSPLNSTLWTHVTGLPMPRLEDDRGRLNAAFVEWLMGLPSDNAANLSRCARIRLAGNAVVGLQARLMLQRGLTATNDARGILR